MAVGAPFDIEHAAVEDDLSMAAGQPAARCRDQRGAGAAAAGARDARAALPYAQANAIAIGYGCDTDIGALGKQRIKFEARTKRAEIDRLGIGHEECRVRIAHAGADRLTERPER